MITAHFVVFLGQSFNFFTKSCDPSIPVLLNFVNTHNLALKNLRLLEKIFVKGLHLFTFWLVLLLKAHIFFKSQFKVILLALQSIKESFFWFLDKDELGQLLILLLHLDISLFNNLLGRKEFLFYFSKSPWLLFIFSGQGPDSFELIGHFWFILNFYWSQFDCFFF